MKWRFAAKFLITFAALLPLYWLTGFGQLFESLVISLAAPVSPLVNGWFLEPTLNGPVAAVFRRGSERMDLLLQLPALAMGLMPLLSLIVATPNQSAGRIASVAAIGTVLYTLVDVAILLVFPFILDHPSTLKDTLGVFSGLVGFVVAPLGLWFVLTYPALSSVWSLLEAEGRETSSARTPRQAGRR